MTTTNEQIQQVRTYFESKDYGLLMQVVNRTSGPSSQKVQDELEIQVENLKNEATKQFDQEHYSECLKSFQFLCELDPQNRNFKDYLELCRQMTGEKEASQGKADSLNSYKIFEEVDLELKKSTDCGRKNSEVNELTTLGSSPVISFSPRKPMGELSRENSPGIRTKPGWAIRLLKSVIRVAALVAGILLFLAMLSHWIHRVRAPHLPDGPASESNQPQRPERAPQEMKNAETKGMTSEDGQIESADSAVQKTPGSGDATQENSQITDVYPVVHEHRLGSCRGQLHLSSNSIAYLPFENSGDAFKHSPVEIIGIELDRDVKIRFIDRTYRFKVSSAGKKQDNHARMKRLFQQLIELRQRVP